MKNYYLKNAIWILFLVILSASCKNYVYIKVMDPAPVSVPSYIKRVGVVNKSLPLDGAKLENKMHQILSGEDLAMIKEGSAESIRGLKDALMENTRFDQIKILDSVDLRNSTLGTFPSPLSWDQVEAICKKNGIDALFTLELFDTEVKISPVVIPRDPSNILGAIQQQVTITTMVKTGWRIYDPQGRNIMDEYTLSDNVTSTASGMNILGTAESLMKRKEAVKQVSNKVGRSYAERILPYSFKVTREYYAKGDDNMEIANRKARTGNWDEAGKIWEKEVQSPSHKIAGRACYNMAIIEEINGNLDKGIVWAQKAYEEHNNKLGLHYVSILRDRKAQANRLKNQQLEGQ